MSMLPRYAVILSPAGAFRAAAEPTTETDAAIEEKVRRLPPFKVILHNDDVNDFEHVILTILKLTPLDEQQAILKTIEAHETGCSVLLITSKERGELYVEQFATFNLTVTCEADE
ncbi:MAG: ATP-dependent Clp protease adaptor ClpS [Planctomycetota bacterium]|nr:MAG: ATP-dependent Clp protease adaptor ClpS [Planctomycetota bacterium]